MAVTPSVNAASVIDAYQGNVMGKDADMSVLIDQLRETFTDVKAGDLHTLEAMLISQATARQTIFTSLARRAQTQEYQASRKPTVDAFKLPSEVLQLLSSIEDVIFTPASGPRVKGVMHGSQALAR